MARAGRFGRLPRGAPDLTNTIVALLREYASQVDSNMLDAWKNGGLYQGQPVTDDRLLSHFRSRRDELSRTDPLWDMWDNRVTQYDFAIQESKMDVKWSNGQVTAAEMAAFYRSWEAKTPDDTEFDRSLRKAAGKWAASANARTSGNASRGKKDAYVGRQDAIYNSEVKTGESLNSAIVWLAKQLGIVPPTDASNLTDTQISQGDIQRLLDIVEDGKATNPEFQGDIDAVTAYMQGIDPSFRWGADYFNEQFDRAREGLNKLINDPDNTKERANNWANRQADIQITNNRLGALSPMADYIAAREEWEAAMQVSLNDPQAQRKATEKYYERLTGVRSRLSEGSGPGGLSTSDQQLLGPLSSELDFLRRAIGGETLTDVMPPTLYDNSTGTTAQSGEDAQGWTAILNAMNDNTQKINDGGWAEPSPDGTNYIWHAVGDRPALGQVSVPVGLTVDGRSVAVWVTPVPTPIIAVDASGTPIEAAAVRTNDQGQAVDAAGKVIDLASPDALKQLQPASDIGFAVLTIPGSNGQPLTFYRSKAPDGTFLYSVDPPISPTSKAQIRQGPNGPVVTITLPETGTATVFDPKTVITTRNLATNTDGSLNVAAVPAGQYLTVGGAMLAGEFRALDREDPNFDIQRNSLTRQAVNAPAILSQQARDFRAAGNISGAEAIERDLRTQDRDMNMVILEDRLRRDFVNDLRGDEGRISLQSTISAFTNLFQPVVPRTVAGQQVTDNRNVANQISEARAYLLSAVDDYETRVWQPFASGGRLGPGSTGTNLPVNPQTLRTQIGAATDPRELKLPSGVFGGTNPWAPASNEPKTWAEVTGSPVIGAPSSTATGAPGSSPAIQPPTISPALALTPPPPQPLLSTPMLEPEELRVASRVPTPPPTLAPTPPTPLPLPPKPGVAPTPF